MLTGRQHDAAERYHALLVDRVADDAESLLTDFAIGDDVVGPVDVEIVDLRARNELVDADCPGRLHLDRLQVFVGDLDVTVARLVPLHDLVGLHHIARLGVDSLYLDAMAGRLIDLVEADLFGLRSGGVEQDRARHEGKTQVALPVGARGHERYSGEHRRRSNAAGCRAFRMRRSNPAASSEGWNLGRYWRVRPLRVCCSRVHGVAAAAQTLLLGVRPSPYWRRL